MKNIVIIAGGGVLPINIAKSLLLKNIKSHIIGIKNNFEIKKNKNLINNFTYDIVKLGSLTKIIKILEKRKIRNIIFAGFIKRPSISDISIDFEALKLLKKYSLESLGDDNLLKSISQYFEKKGFIFIDWLKYCPDLFIHDDFVTNIKPSKNALQNLEKAKNIFNYYGKLDIGQSLIIQNKLVLGVEAIEGTDLLIKRCANYKRKGDNGILLKLIKYKQDKRFDLPTIGIKTIKLLKKYNYEGIFIQKKYCIIIEKDKVIKFANKNNIFIAGI